MIDEFAKEYLLGDLRAVRKVMIAKIDGLSEYDVRRPLTRTGTNLLGLIKHLATWEARYFGDVFGRPFPAPWPGRGDSGHHLDDMWVRADESRDGIVAHYRQAWEYSDSTIESLDIDAPGHVPWWPRPNVKLFNVMVHMLNETNRHAGHADILREQLDGSLGDGPQRTADREHSAPAWETHRAAIEHEAKAARPDRS